LKYNIEAKMNILARLCEIRNTDSRLTSLTWLIIFLDHEQRSQKASFCFLVQTFLSKTTCSTLLADM
jgi:hypothetical protein